jgi:hypothetical protein
MVQNGVRRLTWIAGRYFQSERDRPEQTALWRGDEANSQAILGQSATPG